MARVASLISTQVLVDRMMAIRKRVDETQVQISTTKKSQDYAGVAFDSLRLVSFENQRANLERYVANNSSAQLRLDVQETQVTAVESVVTKLRSDLVTFSAYSSAQLAADPNLVSNMQTQAFNAMKDMEFLLNTRIDGRYLFSGGKTDVKPVDFSYDSVSAFQTPYPGTGADFPVTRAQQLGNTSLSTAQYGAGTVSYALAIGGTLTATPSVTAAGAGAYGSVTFDGVASTITTTSGTWFSSLEPGAKFTVAGSASNNTTYTILSKSGTTLAVHPAPTTEAATAAPTFAPQVFSSLPVGATVTVNTVDYTVTANSGNQLTINPVPTALEAAAAVTTVTSALPNNYYDGDQMQLQHRVDEDRTITLGINATDGAFEKAFRAMGMVAQGDLTNNVGRVRVAINLLGDALQHSEATLPNESNSGLTDVQHTLGRNAVILDDTNKRHQDYMTFLDTRVADMEDIDPLEAVTRIQSDSTALQIAMKTMARISEITLSDYI